MKLMRMILPLPLFALSMLAQDVRYNFSSGTNFERFKTYKWVQIKGADQPDQLADQQIKSAIDSELSKKGLTKTVGETADLFVAYQVTLNQEKQTTMYDSGWAYGPGWRYGYGGGYGGGITTATTSTIQIGQLDLDIYDPIGKQLVWRGSASKTLDVKASPEKRQKNLAKGVAKLLKNFPPPKKG
jgi:hypothetical protein